MTILPYDRTILRLSGKDTRSFLQGITTQDIHALDHTPLIFTAFLSPQGKLLFDGFLSTDSDALLLDLAAIHAEPATTYLKRYKLRADVTITPTDLHPVFGKGHPDPRHPSMPPRTYIPSPSRQERGSEATGAPSDHAVRGDESSQSDEKGRRDAPLCERSEPKPSLTLLDIGTGGGLIAEPMARLGYAVTAIDASEQNIKTASLHAESAGLAINYRATTAEALADTGAQFDVILALEIIEHVSSVDAFLDALKRLLKPGGLLILSTLNRTPKSYAFAIVGAEYILRLLPRGTHQWRKFIRPSELARALRARKLDVTDSTGMVMHPLSFAWSLDARDLDVNYLMAASKPL